MDYFSYLATQSLNIKNILYCAVLEPGSSLLIDVFSTRLLESMTILSAICSNTALYDTKL